MPSYGDANIQQNSARTANDGKYLKLKDGDAEAVYPMFFIGDRPAMIEEKDAHLYQPAEVLQTTIWLNGDRVKAHNDANPENRLPNVVKFEVPLSWKNKPSLWESNANVDPVAWLLNEYYENEEFRTFYEEVTSMNYKTSGKALELSHRVLLWFIDANGSNRYMDISPTGYNKLRKGYLRAQKSFDTLFMQNHTIEREGESFDTLYHLNYNNNDGIEVEQGNLKPLTTDDFGLDITDYESRFQAIRAMLGTDDWFPVSASWYSQPATV